MKIFTQLLMIMTLISLSAFAAEKEGGHKSEFYPKKQADKTLSTRPANPVLVEPKALSQISGNQVTLKWQSVENADSYRVQVASDANFKWLITQQDFVKDTSFNLTGLESGKEYFWRVWAWKTNNEATYMSSYSSMSSFEVK